MREQWPVSAAKHGDARDDGEIYLPPEEIEAALENLERHRLVLPAPTTDPALTEGDQCPRC